jgi:hypothetical protein
MAAAGWRSAARRSDPALLAGSTVSTPQAEADVGQQELMDATSAQAPGSMATTRRREAAVPQRGATRQLWLFDGVHP